MTPETHASLPELIAQFAREEVPMWAEVCEAWGQCDTTTDRFIRYCLARGITGLKRYTFWANEEPMRPNFGDQPNPAPEVYIVEDSVGNMLRNEAGTVMCRWHCVIDAGECLIDFTARQYQTSEHRMEFPTIIPMNKAMAAHA